MHTRTSLLSVVADPRNQTIRRVSDQIADPFVFSAPILLPRRRRNRVCSLVQLGHEVAVAVERGLNRGVAQLRLDVLRVGALGRL